jgi:adenylate cyclase
MTNSNDGELALRANDQRLSEMTWNASASFEQGDLPKAARKYRAILKQFPNDPVAKSVLDALAGAIRPATPDQTAAE